MYFRRDTAIGELELLMRVSQLLKNLLALDKLEQVALEA